LVDPRPFIGRPFSLNPDEPRFEAGFTGPRSRAMLGGQIGLWGMRSARLDALLGLSTFFELHNLQAQWVPWQLLRANVGLMTQWRPHTERLHRAGTELFVSFGWLHESDHAVDSASFRARHVFDGFDFDNGNLSSYEYVDLELLVRQTWPTRRGPTLRSVFGAGVRAYTPAINPRAARTPRAGLRGEARFEVEATDRLTVWLGGYADWTHNEFVPAEHQIRREPTGVLPGVSSTRPRLTRSIRLGLETPAWSKAVLVPSLGYEHSDGRGIDFMNRYDRTFFVAVTLFR